MRNKAIILDTSILCVWLRVPGKETCGPDDNRWTYDTVKQTIESEIQAGATLVLPLAAIIETGNHIAQAHGDKYQIVNEFVSHIEQTLDGNVPWTAFTDQTRLIKNDRLKNILSKWKETALTGQSLGDALIVDVADYYAEYGMPVKILTGDQGLKAYEPSEPAAIPRRRRNR